MQKRFPRRLFWILLVIALLTPGTAFAAGETSTSDVAKNTVMAIVTTVNMGLSLIQVLLWPLMWLAGKLMTNDMIFGNGVEDKLRSIWQDIRNIVDLAFVVILLVIAFSNILGLGQENKYAIKKALPKFVTALILVNFSFFAVKMVLDVTNMATVALIGISGQKIEEFAQWPTKIDETTYYITNAAGTQEAKTLSASLEGKDAMRAQLEVEICNGAKAKGAPYTKDTFGLDLFCDISSTDGKFTGYLSKTAAGLLKTIDPRNITIYMATNLMNINQVQNLSTEITAGSGASLFEQYLNTLINLGIGTLLSIVEFFVFGTALIALVVVLFVRVVVMWNVLVLSPLIALVTFLPDSVKGGLDIQKKAIAHAIAPVIIAATMGIGITILYGLKQTTSNVDLNVLKTPSAVFNSVSDIAIVIGAIVVVWVGVQTAAKDTFANFIVESVQKNVMDLGKFVGKLGTVYAPIMPVSTTGGKSENIGLAALAQGVQKVPGIVESAISTQGSSLAKGPAQKLMQQLGLPTDKTYNEALSELSDFTKKGDITKTTVREPIKATIGLSSKEDLNKKDFREQLAGILGSPAFKDLGIKPEDIMDEKKTPDIEGFLNDNPKVREALFGSKDMKVEDVRRDYKQNASSTPTPPAPKDAVESAGSVLHANKTEALAVKGMQEDTEAKKLKIQDDIVKDLYRLKEQSVQQYLIGQAKTEGKDEVDNNRLKMLAAAAKAIKEGDVSALKTAFAKGLKAEEATAIMSKTTEGAGVKDSTKRAALTAEISTVDDAEKAAAATPPVPSSGTGNPPVGSPPPGNSPGGAPPSGNPPPPTP